MTWAGPLHIGNFGGVGVKLVWLVTGLAPALLAVTGLILWWTRVVVPRWVSAQPPMLKRVPTTNARGKPGYPSALS